MNFLKPALAVFAASVIFCACGDDSSTSSSVDPEESYVEEDSSSSAKSSSSVKKDSKSGKSSSSVKEESKSGKSSSSVKEDSKSGKSSSSVKEDSKSAKSSSSVKGDSKSGKSSSSKAASSSSKKITVSVDDYPSFEKFDADIDETAKTMILRAEEGNDYCVTNESKSLFSKKRVVSSSWYEPSKYEFVGDTLVVYQCFMVGEKSEVNFDDCAEYGFGYVGGKEGNPYGLWKFTGRHWIEGSDKSSAEDFGEFPPYNTMVIADGVIAVPKDVAMSEISAPDFCYSHFVESLYNYFMGKGEFAGSSELYNYGSSNSGEYYVDDEKMAFAIDDVDFVVVRKKIENAENEFRISVVAGEFTCNLDIKVYEGSGIPDEVCKADNADYFEYEQVESDVTAYKVSRYVRGNDSEFKACVDELKEKVFVKSSEVKIIQL